MIKNKYLFFLALIVPYLIIFQAFFSQSPLSWGDAPFFFKENLRELVHLPFLWNFRNDNFGAPQVFTLWLYLPNLMSGIVGEIFKVPPPMVTRIVFYFPATILSIVGGWLVLKKFTTNLRAIFLGSFLYGFNTYNLTLLDGGQVGIALSYGLFPWSLYLVINFFQNGNFGNFFKALLILFVLINSDVRVFILELSLIFFWLIIERVAKGKRLLSDKLGRIFFLVILLLGLNSFWIVPVLSSSFDLIDLPYEMGQNFVSLLASFYLFQPHFPLNEFGKVAPTPFYFVLLQVLLTGGLLIRKSLSEDRTYLGWLVVSFIFVFLAKGESEPFGNFYSLLVDNLPFGVAFRDASKFFIPLMMSAAIVLSLSYQRIEQAVTSNTFKLLATILIFCYLNLLIYPIFFNQLSGNLGGKQETQPFNLIYQKIVSQKDFFRTLWFDERPQLGFSSWAHPAISANLLFLERPFASMIEGSYDLYNFLHSPQLDSWLDLLGVKYVFFPENERKKSLTEKDRFNRQLFLRFIDTLPTLSKLDWQTGFSAYQTNSYKPHLFGQNKVFLVLGGEEIYQKLFKLEDFSLVTSGFIFLEDGKFDPPPLLEIDPSSIHLLISKRENLLDLNLAFLQPQMFSFAQTSSNQWALRDSKEYLKWKNELALGGIKTYDFDYGRGIAYSTIAGEKITFKVSSNKNDHYFLALRYANSSDSAGLKVSWGDFSKNFKSKFFDGFVWEIAGPFKAKIGNQPIEVENMGGMTALNTIALIPQDQFDKVKLKLDQWLAKITTSQVSKVEDLSSLSPLFEKNIVSVDSFQKDPTHYQISIPAGLNWLVFTDHYHPGWRILEDSSSSPFPFYSMVNGFYVKDLSDEQTELNLNFTPQ